jgi:hypothetical protein
MAAAWIIKQSNRDNLRNHRRHIKVDSPRERSIHVIVSTTKEARMTNKTNQIFAQAMALNFEAMAANLRRAAELATEAHQAIQDGQENLAFGTACDLERLLPDTLALYQAAVALRRNQH